MNVNSTQCEFEANLPGWSRARDGIAGEDAVKAAGERYLLRWIMRYVCLAQVQARAVISARKVALPKTCQISFCLRFVAGCRTTVSWRRKVLHQVWGGQGVEKSRANFASR